MARYISPCCEKKLVCGQGVYVGYINRPLSLVDMNITRKCVECLVAVFVVKCPWMANLAKWRLKSLQYLALKWRNTSSGHSAKHTDKPEIAVREAMMVHSERLQTYTALADFVQGDCDNRAVVHAIIVWVFIQCNGGLVYGKIICVHVTSHVKTFSYYPFLDL